LQKTLQKKLNKKLKNKYMPVVCANNCVTSPLSEILYDNCPANNIRRLKPYKVVFLDCSAVPFGAMTDLTSNSQWVTALATANPVRFGELATFAMPKPETEKATNSICQATETVVEKIQGFTFSSFYMDNTTYTDGDFVCDFYKAIQGKTMVMLSCDGNWMLYSKSWTSGSNPGVGGLVGDAWYEFENKANLGINVEVFTDITNDCLAWVKLPTNTFNTIAG
jgi:hypothetical protein